MSGIDQFTSLMLHMDGINGSVVFDDLSDRRNAVSVFGTAQISTAQAKFGGASALFDGNSDYLLVPTAGAFDFGSGPFTIDFWFNAPDQVLNYPTMITTQSGWIANSFAIRYDNVGQASKVSVFWNPDDPLMSSTNIFANNTWHHVAVTRVGTTTTLYVNGAVEATAVIAAGRTLDLSMGTGVSMGWSHWDGAQGYYNGYLDEMRVSKGIVRWAAPFTPPTKPYGRDVATNMIRAQGWRRF